MDEGLSTSKSAETLKSGHLAEGIKPIVVCLGPFEDFGFKKPGKNAEILPPEEVRKNLGLTNVKNVDQEYATYEGEKKEQSLTAGPSTYIISPINNDNKSSENFHRCIGLVVAGIDIKTSENISFLSHQDPARFLNGDKDKFIDHLKQQLTKMKERCKQNTIDAIIIGGRHFSDDEIDNYQVAQLYNDSVKLLGTEIEKMLKFKPSISNGPKTSKDKDSIYYDNKERRLYFIRPKVNSTTGDFVYSDVDNQIKTWEKDS